MLRARGRRPAPRPRLRRRLSRACRSPSRCPAGGHALESIGKKAAFLATAVEATGLAERVPVVAARAEALAARPAPARSLAGRHGAGRRLARRPRRARLPAARAGRRARRLEARRRRRPSSPPRAGRSRRSAAARLRSVDVARRRACAAIGWSSSTRTGRVPDALPARPGRPAPTPVVNATRAAGHADAATLCRDARRRPLGHPLQHRGPRRGPRPRRRGRCRLAPRRRRRLRPRSRRRRRAPARASSAIGVRGNHDAAALGGREIEWFNPDARRAMEWTRDTIDAGDPRLAGGPARAARRSTTSRSSTAARATRSGSTSPRARSRAANLARARDPHGLHGHTHVPIVFRDDDGRSSRRTAGTRGAASTRRPTACSTRAASASRATATRGEPTSCSTRRPRRVTGTGSPTTSRRSRRRDAGRRPARRGSADRLARRGVTDGTPAVIGGRRPLQGRKPGDSGVRVERPHAPYFRYTGPGQLTAKEAASVPTTPGGRSSRGSGRSPSGRPLASGGRDRRAAVQEEGARDLQLGRDQLLGLRDRGDHPAFILAGAASRRSRWPCRSRSRSRRCWPSSPSATARSASPTPTAAARTRCRRRTSAGSPSLVAASALLIDYNLTAAVSTSSAVEQIVSAVPGSHRRRASLIGVGAIALITLGQPARPARGRQHLRGPDVPVPVQRAR